MNEYEVVIQATITKTITVLATDFEHASQVANEDFNPSQDGHEEDYTQDAISITILEN